MKASQSPLSFDRHFNRLVISRPRPGSSGSRLMFSHGARKTEASLGHQQVDGKSTSIATVRFPCGDIEVEVEGDESFAAACRDILADVGEQSGTDDKKHEAKMRNAADRLKDAAWDEAAIILRSMRPGHLIHGIAEVIGDAVVAAKANGRNEMRDRFEALMERE